MLLGELTLPVVLLLLLLFAGSLLTLESELVLLVDELSLLIVFELVLAGSLLMVELELMSVLDVFSLLPELELLFAGSLAAVDPEIIRLPFSFVSVLPFEILVGSPDEEPLSLVRMVVALAFS